MALRQPRTRLKSVDLPTFGRPTMSTIGLDMDSIRPAFAHWRRRRLWRTVHSVVLNRLWRRLIDPVIGPRPCAICGYGHARTGWAVDPMGRAHGRCPHCLEATSTGVSLAGPKPATPRPA